MIVTFEVLSPSSDAMDLRWKPNAYPKLPSLQHYMLVHQDKLWCDATTVAMGGRNGSSAGPMARWPCKR